MTKKIEAPMWMYDALGGISAPRGAMKDEPFIDEVIARAHLEDVRNGTLNEDVRELLDMLEPGWEAHGDGYGLELAERSLNELWMSCWLDCQREAADKGFLNNEQLRALNKGVPGWRDREFATTP